MLFAVAFPMSKILLLEDDPHYREIIERVLSAQLPLHGHVGGNENGGVGRKPPKEDFDPVFLTFIHAGDAGRP